MAKNKNSKTTDTALSTQADLAAQQIQNMIVPPVADTVDPVLGMTAAQAKALLEERLMKRKAAAAKAHQTRKANGTASSSAHKAWETRREMDRLLAELAAKA